MSALSYSTRTQFIVYSFNDPSFIEVFAFLISDTFHTKLYLSSFIKICCLICANFFSFGDIIRQTVKLIWPDLVEIMQKRSMFIYYNMQLFTLSQATQSNDQSQFF